MKTITNSTLITGLLFLLSPLFLYSQSDTPCSSWALTVAGSCATTTGDNNSATDQTDAANGGIPSCGDMGPDVWYSFTAPASGDVTITVFDIDIVDAVMGLYDGPCTAPSELNCNDDFNGMMPEITNSSLTPGNTYYIRIWGYGGAIGSFDICILDNGSTAPANDDPCSATLLHMNTTCTSISGTNDGATNSTGIPAPGCASYQGEDVWYTVIVPSSGDLTVETSAGTITDGGMAIYSGSCNSLSLVQCNDDGGSGNMESIALSGQTPGDTLWVRVWQYDGGVGTFDICAFISSPPPSNINCSAPDPICSGTPILFLAQHNGTDAQTVNPGNDYDCLITAPNPSWYYLDIDSPGNLVIDITADEDVDFAIWGPYATRGAAISSCDAYPTPLDCSYSTSAVEQATVNGVLSGEVYILLVTNFANTSQMISVNEAGTMTATTSCGAVLPVELANFHGKWMDREVHLNWITVSELNNSHFIVERSADGSVWTAFDLVQGMGTTTEVTDYSVVDENPYNDVTYYRLRQFDTDGSIHYSDIITVKSGEHAVHLFPNPASEKVIVNVPDFFSQIEVINTQGAVLLRKEFQHIQQTELDLSAFENGVYYLNIDTPDGKIVDQLIVNR